MKKQDRNAAINGESGAASGTTKPIVKKEIPQIGVYTIPKHDFVKAEEVKAEIIPEPLKLVEKPAAITAPQPKGIKEIIEKTDKMNRLLNKRANIDKAAKDIDSFHLGTDKLGDTLTITDAQGHTFSTTKTDLITGVVSFLKNKVADETTKVEAEIVQLETA